ncbi:MAG: diguanylate cyclase domain-containing protein [Gaiellaceae bacterium]
MADPSRGTRVAIGFSLLAVMLAAAWVARDGWETGTTAPVTAALLVIAAAAERIVVQLGPRSWYTASTPTIVLAALLGGPLVGFAAGVATQVARSEAVWRRRLAEGGLAAIQGLAAGIIGLAAWADASSASGIALAAMAVAVGVNSVGRLLVMLERRATPLGRLWIRGFVVDCLETLLVVPLLAVLLLTADTSPVLVVATMAALLAALTIAKRSRESTEAALAAEQRNARRDQLTGAPNRRAFEEALASEHSRVVRGGTPAGLLVVDIDRFKSINDAHGHRAGDEVLVEVVRRLADGLRPHDVVARWGGEELTVLAPGVRGRRQLEQLGERVRALVGNMPVVTSAGDAPITVSVGGTLLDGSVAPAVALQIADEALYEAKRTRNAVVVSLPERQGLRPEAAA